MGHLGRDSCPAQVCEAPSHSKVSDLYPRRHMYVNGWKPGAEARPRGASSGGHTYFQVCP